MNNQQSFSSIIGQRIVSNIEKRSITQGFWGQITSTVDWCEKNYEHTHYIAEFFNTLSSLSMVLIGLLGYYLHRRNVELRFHIVFLSIIVVGIGSVLFHGTLLFENQMLDEVPMLFTVLTLTYCQIEMEHRIPKYKFLPLFLFLHGFVATFLTASPFIAPKFSSPTLQFIAFHLSFKSLEWFNLYTATMFWFREKNQKMRQLHSMGMAAYAIGAVCWLLDWFGCESIWEGVDSLRLNNKIYLFVPYFSEGLKWIEYSFTFPNPQFHGWWHVGASFGTYMMTLALIQRRLKVLGKSAEIRYFMHLIPYISSKRLKFSKSDFNLETIPLLYTISPEKNNFSSI